MSLISSINFDDDEPVHPDEFSVYGTTASSIMQIPELGGVHDPHSVNTVRVLHSLSLKSMQGIERFTEIIELNLSSNALEKIEGLQNLTKLKVLNLSCNRIRKIDCLSSLRRLEKLILASNRITSLQTLSQLYSDEYNLKYLDLKDNKIAGLAEINHLGGLSKLQEVSLMMEDENNPVFKSIRDYIVTFKALPNFLNLQKIDGRTIRDLLNSAKENIHRMNAEDSYEEAAQEESDEPEPRPRSKSPRRHLEKPLNVTEKKRKTSQDTKLKQTASKSGRKGTTVKKTILRERSRSPEADRGAEEIEAYYKEQIRGLQQNLELLYNDQKELIHKYDVNDRYWSSKCSKLEETKARLTEENRDLNVKFVKTRANLDVQTHQNEELNRLMNDMRSRRDKKEDLVDEQQKRISQLLKENGEFNRELAIRLDDISSLKDALGSAEGRIGELKAVIRENEKNLNDLHSRTLEHNSLNIHRSEELQRKYGDIERELEDKAREMRRVTEKNAELVDLVNSWEKKYEERVNEVIRTEQARWKPLESEWRDKLDNIERSYENEIARNDDKFKENMDILEEEFKKVLLKNGEKFEHLKLAFEEKCKSEHELKQLVKLVAGKNNEFERIIEEQNGMLKKMKEEYMSILEDRDKLAKNAEEKIGVIKSDISSYQANIEKLQAEKEVIVKLNKDLEEQIVAKSKDLASCKRRITELEEGNHNVKADTEKWRQRAIEAEDRIDNEYNNVSSQVEDLKDTIETKNRMLEDKNTTIEGLKDQLAAKQDEMEFFKTAKTDTRQMEEEIEKLRHANEKLQRKVDKASDHIGECKQHINDLEEELAVKDEDLKNMKNQLDKKNQTLDIIEAEVENVRRKQDGEIRDKTRRNEELEQLLNDCQAALIKKKEAQREIEEQFRIKVDEFEVVMRARDKETRELRARLSENEEEMRYLVTEVEKERRQAKENIAKLNQIFK